MALRALNMSLDLPGINSDYSSMLGFGGTDYSPANFSLGTTTLPTQIGSAGSGSITRPDFFSWDSFLGGKNTDGTATNGWGGMALGALQGLGNAYMGMKQYGLAKDQLQFSKDAFNKNYAAQAQMTNASLEDRQRARVASNAGAYQSVGDYMAQHKVAV